MTKHKHSADILVSLALAAAFIIMAMYIAAFGAGIYKDCVSAAERSSNNRTALMYMTQRIRRADSEGFAKIAELGSSGDALVLTETENGATYYTYIYVMNGFLRELTSADYPADLTLGQEIFAAESLALSADNGIVTARFAFADGSEAETKVNAKGAFE